MKLIHFIILPLMCIGLAYGTDHKAETAAAVKLLKERAILKQDSMPGQSEDSLFYTAFRKYQKGEAKITDFPFLSFLAQKDDKKNPIPKQVWTAFIHAGADANAVYHRSLETPLSHASRRGDYDVVKALLDAGADVNAKDAEGCTPLHWAAREGHEAVVKALITAGADANAKNANGDTPSDYAKR